MKETKGCCTCKGPTITFYGVNMYLIFFIRNILSPTLAVPKRQAERMELANKAEGWKEMNGTFSLKPRSIQLKKPSKLDNVYQFQNIFTRCNARAFFSSIYIYIHTCRMGVGVGVLGHRLLPKPNRSRSLYHFTTRVDSNHHMVL